MASLNSQIAIQDILANKNVQAAISKIENMEDDHQIIISEFTGVTKVRHSWCSDSENGAYYIFNLSFEITRPDKNRLSHLQTDICTVQVNYGDDCIKPSILSPENKVLLQDPKLSNCPWL